MKLTLLRHGVVAKKYEGCYNGWIDIDIQNIEPVEMFQDTTFDVIYTSDLIRCTKTLKLLNFSNYKVDPRVREICFKSEVEGKNFDEINPPKSALEDM